MSKQDWNEVSPLLERARRHATAYLKTAASRPVHATASLAQLRAGLAVELTDDGEEAEQILDHLATQADPGIIGSVGPRYFGFVIGGSYPIALATDWLTSTWDQNAGIYVTSPAAAVIEESVQRWILELLHLPPSSSAGFVTGGQMANTTCLLAARYEVMRVHGWDVEARGLHGAPQINVVIGDEAHATIFSALRLLGLGADNVHRVNTDEQGRMISKDFARVMSELSGPIIVCTQAGNVNTGSFDPIQEICRIAHEKGAWVHVDGAFGLWAAASARYRHLVPGIADADSWATDAHKWLNVPYDCGIAIVKNAKAHRAALTVTAAYLEPSAGAERDELDWTPEFSRRARANPIYSVLRYLGRNGVAQLVERCCAHASTIATRVRDEAGIEILNDVVLNQVLIRFGDDDEITRRVVKRVQEDGICWLSGTTWHGVAAMRVSVSNWSTTNEDAEVAAEAILSAFRAVTSSR